MIAAPALAVEMSLQVKLLLYSLLVGAFLGAFFDLLRITRSFLRTPPYKRALRILNDAVLFVVSLIEDILFFAVSALTLVIFCFKTNNGQWRGFMLIALALGFFAYLFTVGRLTAKITDALSALLWTVVGFIIKSIILPIINILIKSVSLIYKLTLGRLMTAVFRAFGWYKTERIKRKLISVLRGIFTKEEGKNYESDTDVHPRKDRDIRSVSVFDNHAGQCSD